MYKKSYKAAEEQLTSLDPQKIAVYVTHFPILGIHSVMDNQMGGCPYFGDILQTHYGITRFLNGHTHRLRPGPVQYECGSDYGLPRYVAINV